MDETRPNRHRGNGGAWSSSKLVATLVLVPAVPMLLLSVASLALFYLAPARFGQLISRLPGESLVRTALVFAPATLFAIVVLALLYAVEQPVDVGLPTRPRQVAQPLRARLTRMSQWLLGPSILALVLSMALSALGFISPDRFNRLLAPLPGDSYWKPLVPLSPWLLFPVTLLLAYLAFSAVPRAGARATTGARKGRSRALLDTAVSAILTFALPSLMASSAALVAYRLRPERVSALLERLPYDSLVRLLLLFAPPTLFSLVVLAVLFLLGSRRELQPEGLEQTREERQAAAASWRASLAIGVLVAGLSLSAFLGMGSLGALLYLLFR